MVAPLTSRETRHRNRPLLAWALALLVPFNVGWSYSCPCLADLPGAARLLSDSDTNVLSRACSSSNEHACGRKCCSKERSGDEQRSCCQKIAARTAGSDVESPGLSPRSASLAGDRCCCLSSYQQPATIVVKTSIEELQPAQFEFALPGVQFTASELVVSWQTVWSADLPPPDLVITLRRLTI